MKVLKIFSGISIMLMCGCGESVRHKVTKIADDFDRNKNKFEKIQNYFSKNSDSIAAIFIDNRESITIKIKGDTFSQRTKIFNFQEAFQENGILLNDSISFTNIVVFLKELKIHSVGGNEKFVSLSSNHQFSDCYNLYYRQYPYSEIDTSIKIRELYDVQGYWYFLLDSNWYFKKENCL